METTERNELKRRRKISPDDPAAGIKVDFGEAIYQDPRYCRGKNPGKKHKKPFFLDEIGAKFSSNVPSFELNMRQR